MSQQNKVNPLSPPQRIREFFSARINGSSTPPAISSPQPYINTPSQSPRKTATGFRQAHKNGPRSDGEILWAIIKARRGDKKAKPSKIPRPKRVKAEKALNEQEAGEEDRSTRPSTPLLFADQTQEMIPRDEKLLESQLGKRASRIPLPARLHAEVQPAAVNHKAAAPSTYFSAFRNRGKAAGPNSTTSKSPPTPSKMDIPASNQKSSLDRLYALYTLEPTDPASQSRAHNDADADANLIRSGHPEFHRNSRQRESMRAEIINSPSPIAADSPNSNKKSKTRKPARATRFADFLKMPKTPGVIRRGRSSSAASTDSDESFQCIGIPPDLPPKDAPPIPRKDERYLPPRLPLQVSTQEAVPTNTGNGKTIQRESSVKRKELPPPRLPLQVSTYDDFKGKGRQQEIVSEAREWSPYHVPSNPFADEEKRDFEMGYEKWLRTQQLSEDDKALNSAGTFRLTQGSWGETLWPESTTSPTSSRASSSESWSGSSGSGSGHKKVSRSPAPAAPISAFNNEVGKTNEELRLEARERRKGIEGLERRAKARRERSLVNKREMEGERRRSSFYGFYDTLLGREAREKRGNVGGEGGFI
ncbi:MAG: hypothetical protein M1812_000592 [Candelaria pacifica]|nr:MAG: hypothetical protein M1812_000592 [Candelaria pacifica]